MEKLSEWVIPQAAAPSSAGDDAGVRASVRGRLRIAMFDNSKANADHLLALLREQVRAAYPHAELIEIAKNNAAVGAPAAVLERLATEADIVVGAMGD